MTSCPTDIVVCANTTVDGILGADVNWTLPNIYQTCSGSSTGAAFTMNFELNEQLLSNQCWSFNYIQRVGGAGGHVKLFSSNDLIGDKSSRITTPYFTIEDDSDISIELNYANGTYSVQAFLVGGALDPYGVPYGDKPLSLKSVPADAESGPNGTNVYKWKADFDSGNDGTITHKTAIYRVLFKFVYTGNKPTNANTGDTIIAVKGFLNDNGCSAGVDWSVFPKYSQGFFKVGTYDNYYTAIYTNATGSITKVGCNFKITVVDVALDVSNVVQPNCSTKGTINAVAGSQGLPHFGVAPYTYVLNPGNISNTTGVFNNLNPGNYTVTVTDSSGSSGCTKTSGTITLVQGDTTPPNWTTIAENLNRIVECSDAAGLAAAQLLAPIASDNGGGIVTYVKTSGLFVAGFCGNAGTYTNTWIAKDACNNSSTTFTQVISIQDTTAPTWTTAATALNSTIECSDT
ncbi:MAG: hypothetical protein Q7U08_08175, partial [Flavobacteriaceae bacterium]|nr:hypothetical protein [Flavobacteriaceae bacterium]